MQVKRRRTLIVTLTLTATCLGGTAVALSESAGRNTLLVAVGSCLVAVPLGTLLSFLLVRTDLPARRFWLGLFTVLLFVPLYLQTAGWDAGFGRMGWQGGMGQSRWFDGSLAAIWIHAAAAVPWVILFVAVGLCSVNAESEEAALLAGSNLQVLARITLLRVGGAIVLACVWVMVTAATESIVTDVYGLDTFARKLFVAMSGLDQGIYATQVAFGTCIISVFVLSGLVLLVRISPTEWDQGTRRPPQFALGRFRSIGFVVVFAVVVATVVVPLANLVFQAGEQSRTEGITVARTWSVEHFSETILLTIRRFTGALWWTLAISASAATLVCAIAIPLAWLGRRGGVFILPAVLCILVGLAAPGPLIAEFVIWLLNRESPAILGWLYDRSILAPTLTVSARGLPAATVVLWFAFRSIANDQLDTAIVDGAGRWRRLWSVAVPQSAVPLAVAWLIGFAVAAGDVTASILVIPPGIETVAVRVFELIHAGVDEQVAGLSLLSATGYLVIGGTIYFLARRWIRRIRAELN